MKLMKHITIALVLCAIPAMAFGQTVSCDDCTHWVSVYMGEGGLVATADGVDKVTWVASCGGVTRHGELPAPDGMVSALFTMDNGLACAEGGEFQLGPIMDGGWYWITDEMNSAVGGLVAKDIVDNATTDPTDAGSGVTMTKGKGAVYMKETISKRVGILPNILPEPPMTPTAKCGFTGSGTAASAAKRKMSNCELGDGKAMIVATSTNAITGGTVTIMDGQNVVRPGGTGTLTISADLWANGTGHFFTDTDGATNGQNFMRGHASLVGTALRGAARLDGVEFAARAGTGPNAGDASADTHGVAISSSEDVGTISITANSGYCAAKTNISLPVSVTATMANAGDADQITPYVVRNATTNVAATLNFTVVCPSASAQPGTELVPDNPFPTD